MDNPHSNTFVNKVIEAYNYNKTNGQSMGNGGGQSTVNAVENAEILIYIAETNNEDGHKNGTVFWNPNLGLETESGVTSPATGLDHELDHAVQGQVNPDKQVTDRATRDEKYGNKEERRVITGSEQKTARANGEIKAGQTTRQSHGGKNVVTNGVTSNTINHAKTQEYTKRRERERLTWSNE